MKIISWNVRGLGSPVQKATVKEVIRSSKADVVLMQETKLRTMSNSTVKEVCGSGSFVWVCRDSVRSQGGILVCCNRRTPAIKESWVDEFSVTAKVEDLVSNYSWIISSVYGPNDRGLRDNFWRELDSIRNRWRVPWCI